MRIGVLTFHTALNYGAVLQMYALQRYMKDNYPNVDIEVIDYSSDYLNKYYSVSGHLNSLSFNAIVRTIYFVIKRIRFNKFIRKYISLSKTKYSRDNISLINDIYDVFIVGSDQVWNPNIIEDDINYFLSFADPVKRFSYAASVGIKEFDENYLDLFLPILNAFNCVSVREYNTKYYFDNLGIKNTRVDIDPTLLIDSEKWESIEHVVYNNKKYILAFTVHYSKAVIDYAVKLGKQENVKVYYVGPFSKDKRVKYIPFPKINDLLNLFHHARYVVTNSFHGTVFSIVYRKNFVVMTELEDGRNSRISNLLESLYLKDRINNKNIDKKIDWDSVEKLLCEHRNSSMKYISRVVLSGTK